MRQIVRPFHLTVTKVGTIIVIPRTGALPETLTKDTLLRRLGCPVIDGLHEQQEILFRRILRLGGAPRPRAFRIARNAIQPFLVHDVFDQYFALLAFAHFCGVRDRTAHHSGILLRIFGTFLAHFLDLLLHLLTSLFHLCFLLPPLVPLLLA